MILTFVSYNSPERTITMTAPSIVDPAHVLGEILAEASPDMMRHLLQTVINALLSADADAVAGAEYGQPTPVASPNATATATGDWTPVSAPSTWPYPNSAPEPTSPAG